MTRNKRFENRLDKSNVKFNTLNPVWDNGKGTGLNVFEMIDLLNELNDKCEFLEIENESLEAVEEKSKLECLLKRTQEQRDKLAEYNVELMEENNELKKQLKDCQQKKQNIKEVLLKSKPVTEQKKLQKLIYKTVINLIEERIKHYSHKPVSAPVSQPMSVNFDEDVDRLARLSELNALKERLQNDSK